MFEAKEQAKGYIDKIRATGKATSQLLLLVFVPLLYLFISEIEPKYVFAKDWIAQARNLDYLRNRQIQARKDIALLAGDITRNNRSIDTFRKDSVLKLKGQNPEAEAVQQTDPGFNGDRYYDRLAVLRDSQEAIRTKLREFRNEGGKLFDSLKTKVDSIRIPVRIPVLNIELKRFSFRLVNCLIMLIYTILLWNSWTKRRLIIATLHKFVLIIRNCRLKARAHPIMITISISLSGFSPCPSEKEKPGSSLHCSKSLELKREAFR